MKDLITKDRRRIYGFFLAATHWVTLVFWNVFQTPFGLLDKLRDGGLNHWPFVPNFLPELIQSHALFFVSAYAVFAILAPLPFLIDRIPFGAALGVFAAAFGIKLAIFYSSYDFMGNYHYMANLVMLCYLVTKGRLFFIQVAVACFYFGAGLLKLNREWISGSALLVETFLSGPILVAACVYVVVLELFLIWGVFAKSWKIRGFTLLQLVAFHAFSWHIVGFYYPLVMILMITIFVIENPRAEVLSFPRGKGHRGMMAAVFLFLVAQLYPKLLNKNDSVTAEGRMLSLNMLDAKTECLGDFRLQTEEGFVYLDDPLVYAVRIRCDPLVYLNYEKHLCEDKPGSQVIFNLKTKKTSDTEYRWVVRDVNLCDSKLSYSMWGNSWVRDETRVIPPIIDPVTTDQIAHWRENPARTGESGISFPLEGRAEVLPLPLQSGVHLAAKSSPVGISDQWILGSDSGLLFAFQGMKQIWTDLFPHAGYGFHGSAAMTPDGHFVIGSYDGILHAVEAKTGKRLWAEKLGGAIGASPLILGSLVLIPIEVPKDHSHFIALDLASGTPIWKTPEVPGLAHASLAYDADTDLLFGATNTGTLVALRRKDGSEVWRVEVSGKMIPSPLVADGGVFSFTTEGWVSKHSLKTGEQLWQQQLPSGGRASMSFSSRNKILIVPSEDGRIVGLRSDDGREVWRIEEKYQHVSSGLIAESKGKEIYWDQCRNQTLCAVDSATGQILKNYSLPGGFSSTPRILGDQLVITLDGESGIWTLTRPSGN